MRGAITSYIIIVQTNKGSTFTFIRLLHENSGENTPDHFIGNTFETFIHYLNRSNCE